MSNLWINSVKISENEFCSKFAMLVIMFHDSLAPYSRLNLKLCLVCFNKFKTPQSISFGKQKLCHWYLKSILFRDKEYKTKTPSVEDPVFLGGRGVLVQAGQDTRIPRPIEPQIAPAYHQSLLGNWWFTSQSSEG